MVAPQFELAENGALVPVIGVLLIVSGAVPVLVTVTLWVALFPTDTEGKLRLVALKEIAGATPVPLRATTCGEPAALSVMERLAEAGPEAVGVKVTVMGQAACGATLPQLAEAVKIEDPVETEVMAKVALPVLVAVTVWLAPAPAFWVPKDTLVGENGVVLTAIFLGLVFGDTILRPRVIESRNALFVL